MLLTIVRKYEMIIVKSMITASGVHFPCFFTKTKLHPGAIKKRTGCSVGKKEVKAAYDGDRTGYRNDLYEGTACR